MKINNLVGKLWVFCSDFRQIIPVIFSCCRNEITKSCFKKSYLWNYLQIFHLTINQRIKLNNNNNNNDNNQNLINFYDYLMRIGNCNEKPYDEDLIKIPNEILSKSTKLNEFIDEIYP